MWGLGEVMGQESEALINGISVLVKKTPESSRPRHHARTQEETSVCDPGSGTSPHVDSALVLDFQAPEL